MTAILANSHQLDYVNDSTRNVFPVPTVRAIYSNQLFDQLQLECVDPSHGIQLSSCDLGSFAYTPVFDRLKGSSGILPD